MKNVTFFQFAMIVGVYTIVYNMQTASKKQHEGKRCHAEYYNASAYEKLN